MEKTGHLGKLGDENAFTASEFVGASTDAAFDAGAAWLKQLQAVDGTASGVAVPPRFEEVRRAD